MHFGAWVLVPPQGAAARCVAACTSELGCWWCRGVSLSMPCSLLERCAWPCALWSLGWRHCGCHCYGAAHKCFLLSVWGLYAGMICKNRRRFRNQLRFGNYDSETCDSETTECPNSETHSIQKLADSESTGCPDSETHSIQKLADSETIRFRNWGAGWGSNQMFVLT